MKLHVTRLIREAPFPEPRETTEHHDTESWMTMTDGSLRLDLINGSVRVYAPGVWLKVQSESEVES